MSVALAGIRARAAAVRAAVRIVMVPGDPDPIAPTAVMVRLRDATAGSPAAADSVVTVVDSPVMVRPGDATVGSPAAADSVVTVVDSPGTAGSVVTAGSRVTVHSVVTVQDGAAMAPPVGATALRSAAMAARGVRAEPGNAGTPGVRGRIGVRRAETEPALVGTVPRRDGRAVHPTAEIRPGGAAATARRALDRAAPASTGGGATRSGARRGIGWTTRARVTTIR